MNHEDYDANNHLEVLPGGPGFIVWLFDMKIGEGETVDAALEDARKVLRRWVFDR